jgi:glutamate synthase (ferredoxin)
MSGGIAYVLDADGGFAGRANSDMVDLLPLDDGDAQELNDLVWKHAVYTGSTVAWRLLADWDAAQARFVKVLPKDYGRVLRAVAEAEAAGLSGDDAVMAAFEANRRDLARVGGN